MRITCQRIGLPPISTSGFGIACVCSWSRVPRPPQRIATGISPASAAAGLAATGDGRQDRHFIPIGDRGVETVLEADVLAGYVDVHETAQRPVLGDPLAQAVVLVEDRVERLADRGSLHGDLSLAARGRAQLGRDL